MTSFTFRQGIRENKIEAMWCSDPRDVVSHCPQDDRDRQGKSGDESVKGVQFCGKHRHEEGGVS